MLGWRWNRGRGGGGQRRDEHWEKGLIKAGTVYVDDRQRRRRMKRKKHSVVDLWRYPFQWGINLYIKVLKCFYVQKFLSFSMLQVCISSVFLHFPAAVCTQGVNHFRAVTASVWKIASDHSEPFLNLWLTINNKQNPRPPSSINTGIARWETAG